MKQKLFLAIAIVFLLGSCRPASKDLPRGKASESITEAVEQFVAEAAKDTNWDLHSVMVLQHGKVLAEQWMSEGAPDKPHVMFSVSKTFTATAVGFAISEGLLSVDDKLVSFFPDALPENMDENMKEVTVKDLLTMNVGMDREPRAQTRDSDRPSWVEGFFTAPVPNKPGTYFMYNSMATYMLSAIVQKVTGEKVNDYLTPRLWEPLGIEKPTFEESPEGINCGGWGLYLKTEDMAKMGQTLLDGGKYKGRQVIPADWVEQMTTYKVPCQPAGKRPEDVPASGLTKENSDWVQGYCYQMWRCRHNAFRADGARGQYILVMPDVDAVVVITEFSKNLQKVLNSVWDIIYPALGGKSPEQANDALEA